MSVIVKGMDMPKSCNDCPMFHTEYYGDYCAVLDVLVDYTNKHTDCPLVDIKPLIDSIEVEGSE